MKPKKCCICGNELKDCGNNAQPIKEGRCCESCNEDVIMERLKQMERRMNNENSN